MNTEFLLTSLIIIASPGTGALVTLAAGLSRGPRAAVVAALGCTLGILPHMLAAITGLPLFCIPAPPLLKRSNMPESPICSIWHG